MKGTTAKMLLFVMALLPSAIQAQPEAVSSVGGKPVPVADLTLVVFAIATCIVLLKTRKKKLSA